MPPAASVSPSPRPSLRERFAAMRNVPPFLRMVWATSPWLTVGSLGLRLVKALLPIAALYVGKLIIDEAVRLVGAGIPLDSLADALSSGRLTRLMELLALEFVLAIGSDLLGPGDQLRRHAALRAVHQRHQHPADGARRPRWIWRTSKTPSCRTSWIARGARPWAA